MNLYDLNKQIISQLKPLSQEKLYEGIKLINNWKNKEGNFYLLNCKELNYFTLFQKSNIYLHESLGELVLDCLYNVGKILDISITEDKKAIEFWIKLSNQDEPVVMYLFNYDLGVVEYYE